jgi:O-acetyl-ADP-ribose deacetylase
MMQATINNILITVVQDDLLTLAVDACVIVTDPNLTLPDKLKRVAGAPLEKETERIGWSDIGSAVMTSAGAMPDVLKLIHAVGPRWGEGAERGKLANLTWECLRIAENAQLRSIAFPPISVGTLGYPLEACATIMIERIIDYTFEDVNFLKRVMLCTPDDATYTAFTSEFQSQLDDLDIDDDHIVTV